MDKKITSFTDLEAWKKGHDLVLFVYKITEKFPKKELFVLTSQIRRAAISVTSNITEGFSRYSYKEKIQFYFMAQGSLSELENQILISKDIGYISEEMCNRFMEQSIEVQKIINGLIKGSRRILNS
ncbi:four helix bundle protein [Candidatus Shapirobacteria bacterium CG_4_9_14_0_2_um_filter_39_11]|uniref:Four helix bundle protein n=1 Tax=Candidatus Shapirobacteria bacterium CG_4_9_14_0_2_um_filter_39_11 TaxID=1974478 RepID=A0A2M8ES52_9BACT|nr:MAG: four helix bundle protein [Candidatus Shapirobacteria bacterium CG_4_9_14_0_2_um_filter_39_11]